MQINGAFGSLGLGPVPEANVNVTYSPRNTLLDEFGEYFDRDGYRYRTINNAVRYRIQISAKGKVEENSVEVSNDNNHSSAVLCAGRLS